MRHAALWVLWGVFACVPAPPRTPAPLPEARLTPAAPFLPEALPLFEGCTPLPGMTAERDYRCGDVTAWVGESPSLNPAQALRAGRERLWARLGAGVSESRVELPLAGAPRAAVRLSTCEGGACRGGYVSAVDVPTGLTRSVGCVARGDGTPERSRCLELMEYLAARGNPEGLALEPGALARPLLPWRYLVVPAGCRLAESTATGGRLVCEDASFAWGTLAPARGMDWVGRWREQTVAELRDTLPGAGPVEYVGCRVEGVSTRCARLRSTGEGGEQVSWVGAAAKWNRVVLVVCSQAVDRPGFPPACNGSLELR
jgi:hypothetical protein